MGYFALSLMSVSLAARADSGTCLNLSDLSDYTVQDDTHLVYNTDFDGKYVFTLAGGCELSTADRLLFKTFSSFEICSGDEIDTLQDGIGNTGFCQVTDISKAQ